MRENGRLGPIEWANAGRPLPGENTSGDRKIAIGIDDDAALFGVVDGLGHGPAAATAAIRAVETVQRAAGERLEVLIQLCHRVLGGTRGVAMTLARVDFAAKTLTWTGVGNVGANLVSKDATGVHIRSSARLAAGIVGYRIPEIRPAQVVSIRVGDLIVLTSDGIAEDHLDHIDFAASAAVIADHILGKHAKETDDAMVLAARHRGTST
ncbi:SpoIIE family protein phosphatase [Mycobacterium montefiorense]|uniref:Stage II sporulation protein E n=1 Tax=Mycobacterium montefiorense TaxID=154654 RepID=A0AA37PLI7_9MYCO|nr:SpoIIE family protein phosphatase [Mycobacterium montefiorense]GBG35974.1 stage II sporulation protein E [Mycobacterium montefiorense]GKU33974.1 stage II sporulation protein E [Mycobacterium montefiorense]GKU41372.1 stage II sporulation protein E [Mycobacterium montefiorense]GKU47470.1 stage II sporulation protein E [Mycobacterium montefiorense]GKU52268.1 stage II sporulation protein E [Mycobacterium montefiorense]